MRDKLIELLQRAESAVYWDSSDKSFVNKIADHLIAHGVTFAEDNNVLGKWIAVEERLPELNESVLVRGKGKEDGFEGDEIVAITERYLFRFLPSSPGVEIWRSPWLYFRSCYEITHWMPLPEPPKEGET